MIKKVSKLKNGLDLISLSKTKSNLISIGVLINEINKNKNKAEIKNEVGVLHFLEHMCFKGTQKYPKEIFDYIVSKNNFNLNGYTTREHALFSIDCLNNIENIYKSIDLLKEMIFNPLLNEEEIEYEKGNVKAELIQFYKKSIIDGDLTELIIDLGHKVFFNENNQLHNSILGGLKEINQMNKNKLIKCHKKYFQPNNMKFIITSLDQYNTKQYNKVYKYFNDTFHDYSNIYNINKNYIYNNDDLMQIYSINYGLEKHYMLNRGKKSGVGLFFVAPSYKEVNRYFEFILLERLLGKYNGIGKGILTKEYFDNINITEKNLFYMPYRKLGLFGIILMSDNKNFRKEQVEKYLINLVNTITPIELQNAKNKLIFELIGSDSTNHLLNLSAVQLHYYNKILENKKIINTINKITLIKIQDLIKELLIKYKRKNYNYIFIDQVNFIN